MSSDGGVSDASSFAACDEFGASGVSVPAHVISTLGNADVESPTECASVDAPFGVESAGPDRVIPLTNLIAGKAYVARVTSTSDLAFYVVTGCATSSGPAPDQCLLFQDGSTGSREVGRFVASSSTAYVIVDFYASSTPASVDFTLDVYAEQCADSSTCDGATPACFEGQCVACVTSFDCTSAVTPVCSSNQTCTVGTDGCTIDGTDEPSNDGPAGATMIALDALGTSVISGAICSSPRTEADYFAFDVTTLGETWNIRLNWSGVRDLDVTVYDATGKELGMSFWEQPEGVRLTYLPLGRYFVRVREFSATAVPSSVTYTMTTQRTFGAACTAAADCAAEYRNQIYRGQCLAGSCVAIDGASMVAEGGACDSESDCGAGLSCPSFFFVADSDSRGTCARACTTDPDCGPLGTGFVCTTYLADNFCVRRCTEDDHCPTSIQSNPTSGPWERLSCDLPTGRCVP